MSSKNKTKKADATITENPVEVVETAQLQAHEVKEAVAEKPENKITKLPGADKIRNELALMVLHKTEILYRNTKGEYFTNENYAMLSENNNREKVAILKKETLEQLIK